MCLGRRLVGPTAPTTHGPHGMKESATAWPVVAWAQQVAMPVIAWLSSQTADGDTNRTVPFLRGLKETGYVEGRNVAVEYRYAANQFERLPTLAADFVRRRVAVIVAAGGSEALVAKAATSTIPIVFAAAGDPVALGLVHRFDEIDHMGGIHFCWDDL